MAGRKSVLYDVTPGTVRGSSCRPCGHSPLLPAEVCRVRAGLQMCFKAFYQQPFKCMGQRHWCSLLALIFFHWLPRKIAKVGSPIDVLWLTCCQKPLLPTWGKHWIVANWCLFVWATRVYWVWCSEPYFFAQMEHPWSTLLLHLQLPSGNRNSRDSFLFIFRRVWKK